MMMPKFFVFLFGIEIAVTEIFSLSVLLEPLAYRTDIDNCEFCS